MEVCFVSAQVIYVHSQVFDYRIRATQSSIKAQLRTICSEHILT